MVIVGKMPGTKKTLNTSAILMPPLPDGLCLPAVPNTVFAATPPRSAKAELQNAIAQRQQPPAKLTQRPRLHRAPRTGVNGKVTTGKLVTFCHTVTRCNVHLPCNSKHSNFILDVATPMRFSDTELQNAVTPHQTAHKQRGLMQQFQCSTRLTCAK